MRKIIHGFMGMVAILIYCSTLNSTLAQGARAAIEEAEKKYVAAFNRNDAKAMAALYAEDAQIFAPDQEIVKGKAAIEEFHGKEMNMGLKQTATTVEVEDHGDWAHETGKWTLADKDGKSIDEGKYIVIWKRQNGQWKMWREIWNSSRPKKEEK